MGLVLHCKLKYRVWPHAHISRLRLKIFFTPKYLPKRPHGTKFRQNPRNGGSQLLHEIENLSVKKKNIFGTRVKIWPTTMRRKELKSSLTICGNLTTGNEDVIIPPLQPCVVIASFCIGQKKDLWKKMEIKKLKSIIWWHVNKKVDFCPIVFIWLQYLIKWSFFLISRTF